MTSLKLRRQIFEPGPQNWAKKLAKNWAKFSGNVRALFALQNDPPNFSQNSSEFITPRLVAEISKFHLREVLGLGGDNFLPSAHQTPQKSKNLFFFFIIAQKSCPEFLEYSSQISSEFSLNRN